MTVNGGHLDMLQCCCKHALQASKGGMSPVVPWFAGFAESFTGTMHFMSLYVTPSLSDLYIEVGMLASVSSGPAVHQE